MRHVRPILAVFAFLMLVTIATIVMNHRGGANAGFTASDAGGYTIMVTVPQAEEVVPPPALLQAVPQGIEEPVPDVVVPPVEPSIPAEPTLETVVEVPSVIETPEQLPPSEKEEPARPTETEVSDTETAIEQSPEEAQVTAVTEERASSSVTPTPSATPTP